MRTLLFFILISIQNPLLAMAEDSFYINPIQKYSTKLNLNYKTEFEFDFCKKNSQLCIALNEDPIIPKLEIHERASDFSWGVFWTLQTLDILTTKQGLKYDCVSEMNPLLPKRPSTGRLIIHKGIIFGIPYLKNDWRTRSTEEEVMAANLITAIVVMNNVDVINSASQNCTNYR